MVWSIRNFLSVWITPGSLGVSHLSKIASRWTSYSKFAWKCVSVRVFSHLVLPTVDPKKDKAVTADEWMNHNYIQIQIPDLKWNIMATDKRLALPTTWCWKTTIALKSTWRTGMLYFLWCLLKMDYILNRFEVRKWINQSLQDFTELFFFSRTAWFCCRLFFFLFFFKICDGAWGYVLFFVEYYLKLQAQESSFKLLLVKTHM